MKNAKQILNEEIAKEQVKLLLPTEREIKSHNGIEYAMVNEEIALRAMEIYLEQSKPKPKKEVKRYFLASYVGTVRSGLTCTGNVIFDINKYPPKWWIEEQIKNLDSNIIKASPLTIQEMTKEDYESFVSKEN